MQPSVSHTQAVLFDFDGTLGRSLSAWTLAYQEALQALGVDRRFEEVRDACFSKRGIEVQAEYSIKDLAAFGEDVWKRVLAKMPNIEMYPQVAETLQDLSESYFKLSIVTNSRRGHVRPVLKRWAIEERFEALVAIDDVSKGKPNPEPIHRALQGLKVPPRQAWMVGDSPVDIEAGKAAGVRTIAFSPEENHSFFSRELLERSEPTFVARSYEEVRRILTERA